MSFISFESGTAKEKARQELREARAEILKKAEQRAKQRDEYELQKKFRGDDQWMLPSLTEKIEKMSSAPESKSGVKNKSRKSKKSSKKSKKEKKKKKKRSRSSSSASDDSSSEEEKISKRKKKKKRFTESESSSESSEQSENEWVEKTACQTQKPIEKPLEREDWLGGKLIPTYSKPEKPDTKNSEKQKHIDSYDPGKSSRELNPYWKDGGTGLPSFRKPNFDDEQKNDRSHRSYSTSEQRSRTTQSWRKIDPSTSSHKSRSRTPEQKRTHERRKSSSSASNSDRSMSPKLADNRLSENPVPKAGTDSSDFLTDQQMNELGAKIVKAEILGNTELAKELQEKLNRAREYRVNHKQEVLSKSHERRSATTTKSGRKESEDVLLTTTNSKGVSRPLTQSNESDLWGGRAGKKSKKSKPVETHMFGERVRYFPDDDKYDIKQMFEKEKFTTAADQDMEFAKIAGSHKNPNDDLEDIFAEKVRKKLDDGAMSKKERERAIYEHQQMSRTLDSCTKCFDSPKLEKQLLIAMGKAVCLALPWHEGLTKNHCILTTLSHTSCVTQLDEDVWSEMRDFMRAINQMFSSNKEDVIFFEMARSLHRRPHLEIHCVASNDFEMAPFYFKKAIQEGEREWSTNKQLIDLKTGDVRRAIPKGLPYFWVTFGIDRGFAHVIEDQDRFPANFAQETIGGLLNLDAQMWRRPRKLSNPIPKVKQFADLWKPFDITK